METVHNVAQGCAYQKSLRLKVELSNNLVILMLEIIVTSHAGQIYGGNNTIKIVIQNNFYPRIQSEIPRNSRNKFLFYLQD